VVTPNANGYSFSPTVQTVTINGANATGINFSASQASSSPYSVGLNWTASVSTVSGYNVYRGTTNGGPYTKLNSSLITSLSYTDNTVSSGETYYYVSTSVNSSGVESSYSNQATALIP
jgi:fibronectin type 3 domain-containing protein